MRKGKKKAKERPFQGEELRHGKGGPQICQPTDMEEKNVKMGPALPGVHNGVGEVSHPANGGN